jgi:hypothetical protein
MERCCEANQAPRTKKVVSHRIPRRRAQRLASRLNVAQTIIIEISRQMRRSQCGSRCWRTVSPARLAPSLASPRSPYASATLTPPAKPITQMAKHKARHIGLGRSCRCEVITGVCCMNPCPAVPRASTQCTRIAFDGNTPNELSCQQGEIPRCRCSENVRCRGRLIR